MTAHYLLSCVSSGLICHIIFNRFEPHKIPAHFILLVAAPLCLGVFCYARWDANILMTIGLYLGTLVTSVIAYRLSPFHPLYSIPGETIASVTRIWSSYISYGGYQHIYYHKLLQKYGTFIRIGPNHIATNEASAIPIILGEGPFRKSDRYVTIVPPGDSGSLLATIDPREHTKRRHMWEKGMNTKAVQGYKEVIHNRIQELVVILSQQQGQDLNLSTWIAYCSFDIMGDLAFNGQFNVMQTGSTEFVKKLHDFKRALGMQDYLMVLTWLRQYIPYVRKRFLNQAFWLVEFSMRAVTQRMKEGPRSQDFFYHLLDEENGGKNALPLQIIFREANLIIPAGYDSTATAICQAFFYLLSNPTCLKKLRDEVDQHFSTVDEVYLNDDLVQNLPYLNAAINETLRLAPSIASGTQLYLPKGSANGGIKLGNTWIPEGTYIQVHTYSLHRNPKYFSPDPEAFRPERWLDDGYITDRAAFIPFSYGPTNCIGKQIALLTIRQAICVMVVLFDLEFSSEFDHNKWAEDTMERFILGRGELLARLKKRS